MDQDLPNEKLTGWLRRGFVLNGIIKELKRQQKRNNSERKYMIEWVLRVCYEKLEVVSSEIKEVIKHVSNEHNLQSLLFRRYILFESWRDVAQSLFYAEDGYVGDVKHRKALSEIRKIVKEKGVTIKYD